MLIYEIMTDPTAHRARFPFRGARCLARRARISGWRSSLFTCFRLCFDEPTSALDPGLTQEATRVVRALAGQQTTMLIVTHDMAFARQAADEALFTSGGVAAGQAPVRQLFSCPQQPLTRQFLARCSAC